MGIIKTDMSISLDGYIAGTNQGRDYPLGEGGERLHKWVVATSSWRETHGLTGGDTAEQTPDDAIAGEHAENVGAYVMGRQMFDNGEKPWGEEPPFGSPVFVVTNRERAPLERLGGTTFYFVTDGLESALKQARDAAGDKDVRVAGGANLVDQCLAAGYIDVLQLHIAPVLFGAGVRLFDREWAKHIELEKTRVVDSAGVTHLRFEIG